MVSRGRCSVSRAADVEVWLARLEPAGFDAPRDEALLDAAERARAARFHFARDAHAFVLGKRLTRTVLGRRLGLPPGTLAFAPGERGKPALVGPAADAAPGFNLAHSGLLVALAVSDGRRVGIDVERVRRGPNFNKLARRFFCPRETRALEAADPEQRRRLFFKFWTLKEAYLKAEGSGISLSLRAVDVSGAPDTFLHAPWEPVEDRPRGLRLQRLDPGAGYAAAVAADGGSWTAAIHSWAGEGS